jgi:rhamnosyltransferase
MAEFLAWTRTDAGRVRELFAGLGNLLQLVREGRAAARKPLASASPQEWRGRALAQWKGIVLALEAVLPAALWEPHRAATEARLAATLDAYAPGWRAPIVSVVIPTRNAGRLFGEALKGLGAQEHGALLDLVVVDSGSTDQTPRLAHDAGARVIRIRPEDFDHGLTRNLGIAHSLGELVMLLTQDAVPADGNLVESLVRAFDDPAVAGAYARQLARPGHGALTAWYVSASYAGGPERRVSHITDRAAYDRMSPRERMVLCNFDNVCSMVRRSVWRALPFPRTDFAEDLEWSRRALEAGRKIVYEPAARVVHSHERGMRYEYARHFQHAAAMRRLFGWRMITGWRQFARRLVASTLRDGAYVLGQQRGVGRKLCELARVPCYASARAWGTFRGGRPQRERQSAPPAAS